MPARLTSDGLQRVRLQRSGLSLSPTSGDAGDATIVTIDPRGMGLGSYTGVITFTADTQEVPESPIAVPVHVHIVDTIWRTHLPLIQRN